MCLACLQLIRLRSNLKWNYASVLAIFQGRLESLLLASRSDPATLDFLNTASQALVTMYLRESPCLLHQILRVITAIE